jgi:hypothetical protein
MKRYRFSLLVSLLILGGLLSGCMGPTSVPPFEQPVVNVPGDYSLVGTTNYIPIASEEDPYPLFVGARWLYQNAAKYWSPMISSSGLLESEVVAIVQGDGIESYVLRTHYSNGPDQLLYLHRTKKAIGLRGSREISAAGSQVNFSLNPGLAFLEFPLKEDATWALQTGEGVGVATVYHRDVAAMESGQVLTMLGTYNPLFVGTWRIHYSMPEISPRLYGGPVQFLWFADGVGVVKHVLNSVDYELAEFRLRDEIIVLEETNDGQTVGVPNGGIVVVQLREGDSWDWEFVGIDGSALELIDGEFYDDTPRVAKLTGAGTRAFQLRATENGEATIWFKLIDRETGLSGDAVQYTIRVN